MTKATKPVVVVTGGASGIGAATCEVLAARGWTVVVADIAREAGEAVARAVGGDFFAIDVADENGVDAVAEAIVAKHGPVTGLVTSAGVIQRPVPPEELPMETWDRIVHIDQRGTYVTCVAFGRRMAALGSGGSIVNIASVAATIAFPGIMGYSGTKSAVDRMTRVAAVEAGKLGTGVRINCIYPGLVPTVMGVQLAQNVVEVGLFPSVDTAIGAVVEQTPLGRLGDPTDMADAVVFLASDASRFITGIGLPVDGGMGT